MPSSWNKSMEPVSDYKAHSLSRLTEWLHDCMGAAGASPKEIYDTIKGVVEEQYSYYKDGASRSIELLELLNGQVVFNITTEENKVECAIGDTSEYCKGAWNNFWEEHYYPEEVKDDGMRPWGHSDMEYLIANQKKKWILPTEVDGLTGEVFVKLPDDLLSAADLKEGDIVNWIDNGDGSWIMSKVKDNETN